MAARHSRTPVSSERSAAGDDPVPGLLNDRNVVVPPNAAATESWKNRSGSASEATRVWVWTSTTPGSTSSPVASTTSSAPAARPPRSGSMAVIRPPSIAISATREPPAVTTVPPRTTRSVTPAVMPSMGIKQRLCPRRPKSSIKRAAADSQRPAKPPMRSEPRWPTSQSAGRDEPRPITRPRGSRSPGRPPTGSAGPSRAAGRPSPRPRRRSRNDWPPAVRPSTPSCSRRTGRRSRTR